jgi:hypothetical protein
MIRIITLPAALVVGVTLGLAMFAVTVYSTVRTFWRMT